MEVVKITIIFARMLAEMRINTSTSLLRVVS